MQDPSTFASEMLPEEQPAINKTGQSTVVCVYQTKIAGFCRFVTVTWIKSLIAHSLSIAIAKPNSENLSTCKIDLKPWHFWSKKGFKTFDVEGKRLNVFWDLRSAKFSGPEPAGDFYVALVCDEEVVLLVGDSKKEAYRRTKSRPSLVDATLISKQENVFGKKCFATRARFDEKHKEQHEIVIENSISGSKDPEMWISIDGVVLIHVNNLQWKFRGNETVFVNKAPVQVFWDVHDWLFGTPGSGHALFIFKPGSPEFSPENEDSDIAAAGSNGGDGAPAEGQPAGVAPGFCLFLYARKVE